jgi:hypothetical protein
MFPPPPDPSIPAAARLTDTAFHYCMRVLKQASISEYCTDVLLSFLFIQG